MRGIQRAGVAACAKHFPGHGATSADSHHEVATLDRSWAELDAMELAPFRAAIEAGSRAVMTGHLLAPALDDRVATISPAITTGLLRDRLGFTGTIVTDALEMAAISATVGMVEGFVAALIAGADTIETGALDYPALVQQIPEAVLAAVEAGRLSIQRLTEAAERTARLAAPGDPAVSRDRAVLASIAARCIELTGRLPRLDRPLVVECRSRNGMATGLLPWSLAARLSSGCLVPSCGRGRPGQPAAIQAAAAGRSLIAVVRDPGRNQWQRDVLLAAAAHQAERADAVVVDVGWPGELAELALGVPVLRTRGIAPGLLAAAAELLVSG